MSFVISLRNHRNIVVPTPYILGHYKENGDYLLNKHYKAADALFALQDPSVVHLAVKYGEIAARSFPNDTGLNNFIRRAKAKLDANKKGAPSPCM